MCLRIEVMLPGILCLSSVSAQDLSVRWEELTAPDFVEALDRAEGVCVLPFSVIEKHGPAGPLGTDLISVRYASVSAAERDYAIVFPAYYFGQIFEAEHQPGTISYSRRLQLDLLQETVSEMGRNGCTKVVVVNGHGGNTNMLEHFLQTQLEERKSYGGSTRASVERGRVLMNQRIAHYVEAIRAIKADEIGPALQREFFDRAANPLETAR